MNNKQTESQGKDGITALARSVANATGGLKPALRGAQPRSCPINSPETTNSVNKNNPRTVGVQLHPK